jgi:hypothetical protein
MFHGGPVKRPISIKRAGAIDASARFLRIRPKPPILAEGEPDEMPILHPKNFKTKAKLPQGNSRHQRLMKQATVHTQLI